MLHLGLDEPQQVLLVHAARVVYVRVDLARVVKVTGVPLHEPRTKRTKK